MLVIEKYDNSRIVSSLSLSYCYVVVSFYSISDCLISIAELMGYLDLQLFMDYDRST